MSTATATNPFSVRTTSGEGGDFELPKGDTYPAALVGLIDLGTHDSSFQGTVSERHKILMVWELLTENDSKGVPFKVAKDFTLSLNSKAKLRAFLEGLEGRKYGDNEEIDLAKFLGQDCMVNVTEGTSASGKRFVDVASASRLIKGLQVPAPSVEPFAFAIADDLDPKFDPPIPEWVPFYYGRKVADEIKASKEWSRLKPF